MSIHFQNQSVLNSVGGNTIAMDRESSLPCSCCDIVGEHLCINCDTGISQKECLRNEGYCDFCLDKGDSK